MPRKTEAQLARAELIDTVRTLARLKHKAELRRELNEVESDALEAFDKALAGGKILKLDVTKTAKQVLG